MEKILINGIQYYKDRYCECGKCKRLIPFKKYHELKGYSIPIFISGHNYPTKEEEFRKRMSIRVSGNNNSMYKKMEDITDISYLHFRIKNKFGTNCVITNIDKDSCGKNLHQHCISGDHKIIESWNWISVSNKYHQTIHSKIREKSIQLLKNNQFNQLENQEEVKNMYINCSEEIIKELAEVS